jgi:hypothetical protein
LHKIFKTITITSCEIIFNISLPPNNEARKANETPTCNIYIKNEERRPAVNFLS